MAIGDATHPGADQNALSPRVATDGETSVYVTWKTIVAGPSSSVLSERIMAASTTNDGTNWLREFYHAYMNNPS